uniref:VWFA domain-containing protein n=1 Tax=Leptocylindrus danicus TaxID=163516 RepID=A0A7S2LTA3_9STRA|mmetsp:Transcript_9178/g.13744  ORF Transcript_9178/g.13744 Transcript_9178/m.13744 type:complete len:438 (+) Transcript_9178:217-1530(+)
MSSYASAPPAIMATAVPVPVTATHTHTHHNTQLHNNVFNPYKPNHPDGYHVTSEINLQQIVLNNQSSNTKVEQHVEQEQRLNTHTIQDLKAQGYTDGLIRALQVNKTEFPIRFWVVDNSGSMWTNDGHRMIQSTTRTRTPKYIDCTRWEEIKETVLYHANMAAQLNMPTIFRLLNHPGSSIGSQQFGICTNTNTCIDNNSKIGAFADVSNAERIMNAIRPQGGTPLTDHILAIQQQVMEIAPQLNATGKRAVVVFATDGIPTDSQGYDSQGARNQFVQALRLMEGLPVWIVIRICTDDDDVVEFYNDLDEKLELSLEVLDDFQGEAKEVFAFNPWLNYALPIHRIRELGFHDRVFDLIDERRLTKTDVRQYCQLLFGQDRFDGTPDPAVDWNGFIAALEKMSYGEEKQWNPISKKNKPLVSIQKLKRTYGNSGCVIM